MLKNVLIEQELLEEAQALSGLASQKEIVAAALEEFVSFRKRKNVVDLIGEIEFADGYDYRAMRCGK
jgi:hypothetical protein